MHIANMLGVSVVAIFSVTNPQITGPVFDSKNVLINQNDFEKEEDLLKNIILTTAAIVELNGQSLLIPLQHLIFRLLMVSVRFSLFRVSFSLLLRDGLGDKLLLSRKPFP